MSERGAGLSVTATRQNCPSVANTFAPPGPPARPAGGVNAPGATVCASVTVPFFTASEVRLSHVAAAASDGSSAQATHATTSRAAVNLMARILLRALGSRLWALGFGFWAFDFGLGSPSPEPRAQSPEPGAKHPTWYA